MYSSSPKELLMMSGESLYVNFLCARSPYFSWSILLGKNCHILSITYLSTAKQGDNALGIVCPSDRPLVKFEAK